MRKFVSSKRRKKILTEKKLQEAVVDLFPVSKALPKTEMRLAT
jgi:hypothetical protein